MKIHAASAVVPVSTHKKAVELIHQGLADDLLGPLDPSKIQICPQHAGYVTDDLVEDLMTLYPGCEFRLHAAPKLRGYKRENCYLSNAAEHMEYFRLAEHYNAAFGAGGYSIHAGERSQSDLNQMIDNLDRVQQISGRPIAVEGLYPSRSDRWLMSKWSEYEKVAERGCLYALDLSHLNIVVRREGRNDAFVEALMQSNQCLEIHVSGNNGLADTHKPLDTADLPWWLPMLSKANPDAVIFYEGVLVDPIKAKRQKTFT